ncbi:hypothetical protein AWC38_SpisGene1977 [Stylophora pistillata]|uniref:Integrase catalytic domain-containing protein n=1 Tax=Stylophora pistillata TaxID=50429 RepID=A0A2B4SXG9_STYPI|nr:hypothetical protein AWC38_SpisGene1977 [Stylophora pistillata]
MSAENIGVYFSLDCIGIVPEYLPFLTDALLDNFLKNDNTSVELIRRGLEVDVCRLWEAGNDNKWKELKMGTLKELNKCMWYIVERKEKSKSEKDGDEKEKDEEDKMVTRRGKPEVMISDNGTNFMSAERELPVLVSTLDQTRIKEQAANEGIQWRFNPPGGSHPGGVFEALIKSVKKAL